MKRLLLCVVVLAVLCGCRQQDDWSMVLQVRERMLQSQGCTFDANITADYGSVLHNFSMSCQADRDGTVMFEVTAPQTIAGISGSLSADGGILSFDDTVLAFEFMADGRLSPVCAPWVLIHTLRSGYIKSYSMDNSGLQLEINDSYEEDALGVNIQLNAGILPQNAEIYWQGSRILTVTIENFCYE